MFKETTIEIVDKVLQEITGKESLTEVAMSFDINEVAAFRETVNDELECTNKCIIYLKCGEMFIIDIPYKEVKKLFN